MSKFKLLSRNLKGRMSRICRLQVRKHNIQRRPHLPRLSKARSHAHWLAIRMILLERVLLNMRASDLAAGGNVFKIRWRPETAK